MPPIVENLINVFLLVYAGLFPIVNPIGGAPIFLGLTRHCSDEERNGLALRVTINSFFLLLGSVLAGSYVLDFFGITLPIVRVTGGLIVTVAAWNLLQAGDQIDDPGSDHKPVTPTDSFYPLTMPITVGPGSIAVAITIGSQRPKEAHLTYIALLGGAADRGLDRDGRDYLSVLSLCRRNSGLARRAGHQRCGAIVGLHLDVHRHRNHLERLQFADAHRQLVSSRSTV